MNEPHARGRYQTLQLLRGIAASVVVIFHAFGESGIYRYGVYGVDLFFVLSGFIILYIHHVDLGVKEAIKPFLLKRLIRIFPLYWIVTACYIVMVTVFGHSLSMAYILKSLFLLPQDKLPVVGVAWTLQFEMLFYVIFCLLLFNKRLFYWMLGLWGLSIIWFAIAPISFPTAVRPLYNPLNLEFLYGCCIALAVLKNKLNFKWTISLSLICLAASFVLEHYSIIKLHRAIAWGIPFAMLILGLVKLEIKKELRVPKLLTYIGDASYSIYLSHLLTLLILESTLERLGIYKNHAAVQLILSVFAILIGCLCYSIIEKPLLRSMRSWFANKKNIHAGLEIPKFKEV